MHTLHFLTIALGLPAFVHGSPVGRRQITFPKGFPFSGQGINFPEGFPFQTLSPNPHAALNIIKNNNLSDFCTSIVGSNITPKTKHCCGAGNSGTNFCSCANSCYPNGHAEDFKTYDESCSNKYADTRGGCENCSPGSFRSSSSEVSSIDYNAFGDENRQDSANSYVSSKRSLEESESNSNDNYNYNVNVVPENGSGVPYSSSQSTSSPGGRGNNHNSNENENVVTPPCEDVLLRRFINKNSVTISYNNAGNHTGYSYTSADALGYNTTGLDANFNNGNLTLNGINVPYQLSRFRPGTIRAACQVYLSNQNSTNPA